MAETGSVWTHYAQAGFADLADLWPVRDMQDDLLESFEVSEGQSVLDVGCGSGLFRHTLARPAVPPVIYTGLDSNLTMLQEAEEAGYDRTEYLLADLDGYVATWRVPLASFDAILASNVLYILRDPLDILRKLLTLGRPGARLVISTPRDGCRIEALIEAHLAKVEKLEGTSAEDQREAFMARFATLIEINEGLLANPDYHFLEEGELRKLVNASGWKLDSVRQTYAGQNWLVTAHKAATG